MNLSKISALLVLASLAAAGSAQASTVSRTAASEPVLQLAPVFVEASRETTVAAHVQASLEDLRAAAARPISLGTSVSSKGGRQARFLPVSGAGKRLHAPRVGRL